MRALRRERAENDRLVFFAMPLYAFDAACCFRCLMPVFVTPPALRLFIATMLRLPLLLFSYDAAASFITPFIFFFFFFMMLERGASAIRSPYAMMQSCARAATPATRRRCCYFRRLIRY